MKEDHYFKLKKVQIRRAVFHINKDWQNSKKIMKDKIKNKIRINKLYNKKNKFKNNKLSKKLNKKNNINF